MSQDIWSSINPFATTGTMLAAILDDFKDALMTGMAGLSRPSNIQAGGMWIDTTNQGTPTFYWSFKLYTGTTDFEIFRLSIVNGFGGTLFGDSEFDVKELRSDTTGAIIQLIKNRIANNAQVVDGDVVAEIRFIGRTLTETDPTVAYLRWTATDTQTVSVSGGTLSLCSTPDASSTATEHLKLISGIVESVESYKPYSQRLVSQNVATTSTTILALSASKPVVEFTGATDTCVGGIDATGVSQVITIHNRSTGTITLKNSDTTATAANRIKFPGARHVVLVPQASIVLYYCTTDTRWKMKSGVKKKAKYTERFTGVTNTWVCPSGVTRIYASATKRCVGVRGGQSDSIFITPSGATLTSGANGQGQLGNAAVGVSVSSPVAVALPLRDTQTIPLYDSETTDIFAPDGSPYAITTGGKMYMWGSNGNGQLGNGDVTSRSSPVAVLGGLSFVNAYQSGATATYATTQDGTLYAWGNNTRGELGLGDVIPRSSPVAVLGGLKFVRLLPIQNQVIALTADGTAYGWGRNVFGSCGLGDSNPRSSPVAVLGGLKFKKVVAGQWSTAIYYIGLTTAGTLYGWGENNFGQLGDGSFGNQRSSPVAVIGGMTFANVVARGASVYGIQSDGTVYSWGENATGALGLGDTTHRSSPVAVTGGLKFKFLAAGQGDTNGSFAIGITADGTAYAWGNNGWNQLGVGTDFTNRSSPVALSGGLKFSNIMTTINSSDRPPVFGIATDGGLYAWGYVGQGGAGIGTLADTGVPTTVANGLQIANRVTQNRIPIDVVAGTTYTITLSHATCSFGPNNIGTDLDELVIQYSK